MSIQLSEWRISSIGPHKTEDGPWAAVVLRHVRLGEVARGEGDSLADARGDLMEQMFRLGDFIKKAPLSTDPPEQVDVGCSQRPRAADGTTAK